jgi:DNA-binding HxlR family transcriptional regulator
MASGISRIEVQPAEDEDVCVAGASIPDVLRLLGAGATGSILMALGEGPLRTKSLTERVPGYAPRTIYRYAGRLAELDVIERDEEPGVPSKVVHTLTDPCGSDLYELVKRFFDASAALLPDSRIDAHAWASLGLLADLWEAGMVAELSCHPKSPTELARGPHGLSYHQVNRRAGLFKTAGLVRESEGPGRRRCYGLTEKTRKAMGLIVGIARWRHRHVVAEDEEGMTAAELATALRAALPLVDLPGHAGKRLMFCVAEEDVPFGAGKELVWAEVEADGSVHSCSDPSDAVDGQARGRIENWIPAILEGNPDEVRIGEDERLVGDCLEKLYGVLWAPSSF